MYVVQKKAGGGGGTQHVSTYYKFSQYTLDNATTTTTLYTHIVRMCVRKAHASRSRARARLRIFPADEVAIATTTTSMAAVVAAAAAATTSAPSTLPSASQNI